MPAYAPDTIRRMSVEDDPSIPDELKLYRRITPDHHLVFDEELQCWRITSGAFGSSNLSVVLDDKLTESGRAPAELINGKEPYLVSLTAGDARAAGQGVLRLPE